MHLEASSFAAASEKPFSTSSKDPFAMSTSISGISFLFFCGNADKIFSTTLTGLFLAEGFIVSPLRNFHFLT